MTVLSGSISPQMGGAIRVPIDSGEIDERNGHQTNQSNRFFLWPVHG